MPSRLDNFKGKNNQTQFKKGELKAVEAGRKGAEVSTKVRRKKSDFRATLNYMMSCELQDGALKEQLKALGMGVTFEDACNLAMIKQASKGNAKAFQIIRDTMGISVKSDADIKAEAQKHKLELEKLQLEIDRLKKELEAKDGELYESDGFIDALNADTANTFKAGAEYVEE